MNAPGSFVPCVDRTGRFDELSANVQGFVIADERVARLHPHVARFVRRNPHVLLRAGEQAKSLRTLERLGQAAVDVPRSSTIIAIGGGTVGDVATVFAHLHKRGAPLLHVPTTWLAAVDSSVGGKGAVNLSGRKNALGVFHSAFEAWLCPELFTTLTHTQRLEGEAEAFKMALTLDEKVWRTWRLARPDDASLIHTSRALKTALVTKDPYEQSGLRAVLNFGHTFAHVIESHSKYRVRHGIAVALGMVCALDVGRSLGVTPATVASEVEAQLPLATDARRRLARVLSTATPAQLERLLAADKKGASRTHTRFVLLKKPGAHVLHDVEHRTWRALLPAWKAGRRP